MLKLSGKMEHAQHLLKLLGKAAGLSLILNNDSVVVQGSPSKDCPSPILCEKLIKVINDKSITVTVNIVSHRMHFGAFGRAQSLSVINAYGIDEGAPGIGAVIAFHEIWENYISRLPDGSQSTYGPAHHQACELERILAGELTRREGGRVAVATIEKDDGDEYVVDMEGYFVMLTNRAEEEREEHGRFTAAIRERALLKSFILSLQSVGRVDPALIQKVVSEMKNESAATAKITALRLESETGTVAEQRAQAVRNAMIVELGEDKYADKDGTDIETAVVRSKGKGADLATRRSWVAPAVEVGDVAGVRVDLYKPA